MQIVSIMLKRLLPFILLMCSLFVEAQMLVIPDVHGRTYWKEAVAKYPDLPVVFLGDYLDPYSSENISAEEALANFREILAYKKANMARVTLLIGNHEVHYLCMEKKFSRKDMANAAYIHDLLYENLSFFRLAASARWGGRTFLFTHAGVLQPWWKKHFPNVEGNVEAVCQALNDKLRDEQSIIAFTVEALMDASKIRGGHDEAGSCVWADVHEHNGKTGFPPEVYQVFGHSQQKKKAKIKNGYADLDCRRAFLITADGKIVGA